MSWNIFCVAFSRWLYFLCDVSASTSIPFSMKVPLTVSWLSAKNGETDLVVLQVWQFLYRRLQSVVICGTSTSADNCEI